MIHQTIDKFCGAEVNDYDSDLLNALKQYYDSDPQPVSFYVASKSFLKKQHFKDLKRGVKQNLIRMTPNYLQDFNWSYNVVVSSDKLNHMKDHRYVLELTGSSENIVMELNKSELELVIQKLEEALKVGTSVRVD